MLISCLCYYNKVFSKDSGPPSQQDNPTHSVRPPASGIGSYLTFIRSSNMHELLSLSPLVLSSDNSDFLEIHICAY